MLPHLSADSMNNMDKFTPTKRSTRREQEGPPPSVKDRIAMFQNNDNSKMLCLCSFNSADGFTEIVIEIKYILLLSMLITMGMCGNYRPICYAITACDCDTSLKISCQ